jgi:succinate dehydrogenase / fumarate reductase iron-sulfur subunit
VATADQHIVDRNNGERHEQAITSLVRDYGLLHEAELIPRSYGGDSWFAKFTPAAGKELLSSLPVIAKGILRGKLNPKIAIFGHKIPREDLKAVQSIYERIESRPKRYELNLYIAGEDEADESAGADVAADAGAGAGAGGAVAGAGAGDEGSLPDSPEVGASR